MLENLEPRFLLATATLPIASSGHVRNNMTFGGHDTVADIDVGLREQFVGGNRMHRGFAWLNPTQFRPGERVALDSYRVLFNYAGQHANSGANFNTFALLLGTGSTYTLSNWNDATDAQRFSSWFGPSWTGPLHSYAQVDNGQNQQNGSINTGQDSSFPVLSTIYNRRSATPPQMMYTAYVENPESQDNTGANDSSHMRISELQFQVNYTPKPTLTTPSGGSYMQDTPITLQWSADRTNTQGDIGFRIQYSQNQDFSTSLQQLTTNTSFTFSPNHLTPGGTWYWRVQARNTRFDTVGGAEMWTSDWSETRSFTVVNPPPVINGPFDATPNPVTRGTPVSFDLRGVTDNFAVNRVELYRDSNGNGVWDTGDASLERASNQGGGRWTLQYTVPTSWSTGQHLIFARARDHENLWGSPVSMSLGVLNAPPVITSLVPPTQTVNQGSAFTLTATAHDTDGAIVEVRLYWDDGSAAMTLVPGTTNQYQMTTTANWDGERHFAAQARDNDGALSNWGQATVTSQVVNLPNLRVTSVAAPSSPVSLNGSINLSAQVSNNGTLDAGPFQVSFWLGTTDLTAPIQARYQYELTPGNAIAINGLPVQSTATASRNGVSQSAPAGSYRIWALADSNDQVNESNESDNWGSSAVFTIIDPPIDRPNLLITSIAHPPSPWQVGSTVTLGAGTRNDGTEAAGSFTVTFWLGSTSLTATEDQRKLHQLGNGFPITSLAAGATHPISGGRTVQAPTGTYRLWVMVDSGNAFIESNESDNWQWSSDLVIVEDGPPPRPDLTVPSVYVNPTGPFRPGDTLTAIPTIRNNGAGPSPSSTVGFYIGAPNGANRQFLGTAPVAEINAGSNRTPSASLTIPWNLAAGTYVIWVFADQGNSIFENSEGNNWGSSVQFTVSNGPGAVPTPAASAAGTASASRLTVTVKNQSGRLVVAQRDGSWSVVDLDPSSPVISGDPVTWHDPKDNRTYIAAVSNIGQVLLWKQQSNGTWAPRNLSAESGAGLLISGQITAYVDKDGIAVIAGLSVANHMVMYRQTGQSAAQGFAWHATNLTMQHGLPVVPLVGRLFNYVTAWNQETVGGLDSQGRVWAIWRPAGGTWSWVNLTAMTGAPPLVSVTVYLTSWSGINIVGVDNDGQLQGTWWVPENPWRTTSLSGVVPNSPQLKPDSLTSFVTTWDALNIVAADVAGRLVVFWWTPTSNLWRIAPLSDISRPTTGRPLAAGTLEGTTSPDDTMSIVGTTSQFTLFRYHWNPRDGEWHWETVTNL